MLTFFRKIIFSRIGALVTLIIVGLIGVAFGLGDVTGLRSNALGGQSAATAATVGNDTVSVTDLRNATDACSTCTAIRRRSSPWRSSSAAADSMARSKAG